MDVTPNRPELSACVSVIILTQLRLPQFIRQLGHFRTDVESGRIEQESLVVIVAHPLADVNEVDPLRDLCIFVPLRRIATDGVALATIETGIFQGQPTSRFHKFGLQ